MVYPSLRPRILAEARNVLIVDTINFIDQSIMVRVAAGGQSCPPERDRRNSAFVAQLARGSASRASIFFLDGGPHRLRRAAIVRFFAPETIAIRHLPVIEPNTGDLIAAIRSSGRAKIDDLSFHRSAVVVAEIVGLTSSKHDGMMRRLAHVPDTHWVPPMWQSYELRNAGIECGRA